MQTNPIYSLLTKIRNGYKANKNCIIHPFTKVLLKITTLLYNEGFIRGFFIKIEDRKKKLYILLKYQNDNSAIKQISSNSFPKSNFSLKHKEIIKEYNGKGLTFFSTNKGIMTNETAFKQSKGGKVLFKIK